MIQVSELDKRFGAIHAVAGVSFRAADGEITGLLGPNGAGKTTTLRMLYGLTRADSGSATIDGVDIGRSPRAAQQRLGVVPDQRGLYPRLTAREHIHYFGSLQGLAGATLDARIEALLDELEMRSLADRRVQGFSQGERAKVAIARALIHAPQNLILDEPTNGLDVMATRSMRGVIRELKRQGRCVVFSSHIMQEVGELCDRVVVIARGKVVATGTPAELLERAGTSNLEDAFVDAIGSAEGLG
ncbi:MAG: ATP-binding cassette domain-containing protein [Polyangiaceae bacterium]|nr:ATP-binding cassette domain-containing protein [Polyangiaceae bacterium]MCB9608745.1 ATP-binding cassette domain-containing protein [Polyangiaceae bacterium]